jgi:hypothetical protein
VQLPDPGLGDKYLALVPEKVTSNRSLPYWIALVLATSGATPASAESLQLEQAHGPYDGLIYDVTFGPVDEGNPAAFALSETGVYEYDETERVWSRLPILAPEDALLPATPFRVDAAHLVGDPGLYQPRDVTLMVTASSVFVHTQVGRMFTAPRAGGPWTEITPPDTTGVGARPWQRASRISVTQDTTAKDRVFVLRADEMNQTEASRLWQFDPVNGWTHQDLPNRAVFTNAPGHQRFPRWRQAPLTLAVQNGDQRHQVENFIRLLSFSTEPRFHTLPWRSNLDSYDADTGTHCARATGMMETATGFDKPPVLFAIGRGVLCASTDGGGTFEARLLPGNPASTGAMASAVAFPLKEAAAGVRILVGTNARFDPDAPKSRAFGGKLFVSDDAGETWLDATPDIDAPGGFLSLAAAPIEDGEVWVVLLTGRRGVYQGINGLGFTRASRGLNATPVHALARDPKLAEVVFAASPTGLYLFKASGWVRVTPSATRSLAAMRPGDSDSGLLWIGTYWGSVKRRTQGGRWKHEPLPARRQAKALDIRATTGTLPVPIPLAPGLRPVSIVTPVDIDSDGRERGYAFIDGEGIFARDGSGKWTFVPSPLPPPFQVAALVAAPLSQGEKGAVLFTRKSTPDGVHGGAYLHHPTSGWSKISLAKDIAPHTAWAGKDRVWMSAVGRGLFEVYTKGEPPKVSHVDDTSCEVLTDTPDGALACITAGPAGAVLTTGNLGTLVYAGTVPQVRMELLAINPSGRKFAGPRAAALTRNQLGTWPWVTPGIGVYAPAYAMRPVLPASSAGGVNPLSWVWTSLCALLAISALVGVGFGYRTLSRFARRILDD